MIEVKLNSNIVNTFILAATSSAGTQFLLTFTENYVEADWPAANYSLRLYLSVCGSQKAQVSFYYLIYSNLYSARFVLSVKYINSELAILLIIVDFIDRAT